jgi:hypothetical protein
MDTLHITTILIGAIILAAISGIYQLNSEESGKTIKPKAVLRDGILGGIFTAMAWTLVPESMKSITESVTTAASTAATTAVSAAANPFEYDVQVGPPRF